MMTGAGLLFWVLWHDYFWPMRCEGRKQDSIWQIKKVVSIVILFLPGFALGLGFLYWHHQAVGWTGFHPDSPWAPAFVRTGSAGGLLRNAAVVAWRWLDFGRVLEWFILGVCFLRLRYLGDWQRHWVVLLVCTAVFLTPSALLYQNLSAHRYFLPFFLSLHVLVFSIIVKVGFSRRVTIILFTVLTINMALGNRWIYPMGISMDWDSTLGHLPYHRLRADAVQWLDKQGIDYKTVGTSFPALNTGEHLVLNDDNRIFSAFDTTFCQHLMVSNVFNDIEADVWEHLPQSYRLAYRNEHAGVWIEIWSKK
jgi:hypothetical protein